MRRLGYVFLLAPLALLAACGDDASDGDGGSGGEGGDDTTSSTTKSTSASMNTTGSMMTSSTGMMMSSSTGMSQCGNDEVDAGEECDGTDLDGETCASQGFLSGTLDCASNCTFDTSGCMNEMCGNDAVEGMEVCDGTDLDGESCITQGFDTGTLGCNGTCTAFDTSACVMLTCGDGMITGMEQCDGVNLGGATCASQGFDGGTLACSGTCAFNTAGCLNENCYDTVDNDGDAMVDCADTGSCASECGDACFAVPTILDPSTTTGNTTGHADDYASGCSNTSGPEVVYQVVASQTGFMHLTLNSTVDLGVSAWTGCASSGTENECEDDIVSGNETISVPVTTGETVHVMVDAYNNGVAGAFTLTVATIAAPSCGDGFVDGAEACDDGNLANGDGCDSNCTATGCGNGIVTGTEICDDGNTSNSDGCSAACTTFECAYLTCPGDALACTAECTPTQGCVASFTPGQPHGKCSTGVALIDTPGCTTGNQGIIAAICDADPYCCGEFGGNWDTACVNEVFSVGDSKVCSASQGTCAHTLCVTGTPLVANCDSAFGDCVDQICAADPFCCNPVESWDSQCVGEVASICGLNCN